MHFQEHDKDFFDGEYNIKCVHCKKFYDYEERDLELCNDCIDLFDLDKLWLLHDNNKLDALDFNESKSFREGFLK